MVLREKGAESIAAKYQEAERYLEKPGEALEELKKAADAAAAKPESQGSGQELQKKLERRAEGGRRGRGKDASNLPSSPCRSTSTRELAKRLAKMAKRPARRPKSLAKWLSRKPAKPGLTAEQMEQLKKMAKQMAGQRKHLDEQAIQPLETTAASDAADHGSAAIRRAGGTATRPCPALGFAQILVRP